MSRNFSAFFSFANLSFIQGSNVLIQLLLIPIITRIVGLQEFGLVMLASSYAALVSIFINYGSNQSGVKDVAQEKESPSNLSKVFYSIYIVRIAMYLVALLGLLLFSNWLIPTATSKHFLFANMIIVGELLNPFFFFVALQKLLLYNLMNLFSKVLSVILILWMVKSPSDSVWVNFFLGLAQIIGYIFLLVYLIKKFRLYHFKVPIIQLKQYLQQNFYLTGNNLSVQLQQSIFLFTVSGMGNAQLLGAYSLCDKLVWSFRMLVISFFNVVYPRAAVLYKEQPIAWKKLKKQLTTMLWLVLTGVALVLLFFANQIVVLITGNQDDLTALFIQSICLMPLVAGLNSLNVTELLLRNQYKQIFNIALILLTISILLSILFTQWGNPRLFGFFPILVEMGSIPLYLYFIKKTRE
ncbi:MAG: oligosaccharide flippase family protein [Sediminibacterium sp.]